MLELHVQVEDLVLQRLGSPLELLGFFRGLVALGLGLGESPWTVLTGVDNYYVPLFVETVVDKIRANPDAGLVYYDFLLDMKGELAAGAAYDAALVEPRPSKACGGGLGVFGGRVGAAGE